MTVLRSASNPRPSERGSLRRARLNDSFSSPTIQSGLKRKALKKSLNSSNVKEQVSNLRKKDSNISSSQKEEKKRSYTKKLKTDSSLKQIYLHNIPYNVSWGAYHRPGEIIWSKSENGDWWPCRVVSIHIDDDSKTIINQSTKNNSSFYEIEWKDQKLERVPYHIVHHQLEIAEFKGLYKSRRAKEPECLPGLASKIELYNSQLASHLEYNINNVADYTACSEPSKNGWIWNTRWTTLGLDHSDRRPKPYVYVTEDNPNHVNYKPSIHDKNATTEKPGSKSVRNSIKKEDVVLDEKGEPVNDAAFLLNRVCKVKEDGENEAPIEKTNLNIREEVGKSLEEEFPRLAEWTRERGKSIGSKEIDEIDFSVHIEESFINKKNDKNSSCQIKNGSNECLHCKKDCAVEHLCSDCLRLLEHKHTVLEDIEMLSSHHMLKVTGNFNSMPPDIEHNDLHVLDKYTNISIPEIKVESDAGITRKLINTGDEQVELWDGRIASLSNVREEMYPLPEDIKYPQVKGVDVLYLLEVLPLHGRKYALHSTVLPYLYYDPPLSWDSTFNKGLIQAKNLSSTWSLCADKKTFSDIELIEEQLFGHEHKVKTNEVKKVKRSKTIAHNSNIDIYYHGKKYTPAPNPSSNIDDGFGAYVVGSKIEKNDILKEILSTKLNSNTTKKNIQELEPARSKKETRSSSLDSDKPTEETVINCKRKRNLEPRMTRSRSSATFNKIMNIHDDIVTAKKYSSTKTANPMTILPTETLTAAENAELAKGLKPVIHMDGASRQQILMLSWKNSITAKYNEIRMGSQRLRVGDIVTVMSRSSGYKRPSTLQHTPYKSSVADAGKCKGPGMAGQLSDFLVIKGFEHVVGKIDGELIYPSDEIEVHGQIFWGEDCPVCDNDDSSEKDECNCLEKWATRSEESRVSVYALGSRWCFEDSRMPLAQFSEWNGRV